MQFGEVKKKNKFMINIDQNYINKIFKELLKQPIYKVNELVKCKPKPSPGLYLTYCDLIKSHTYLRFGKGENLRVRINKHLNGSVRSSIHNRKLSKDEKIKALLPFELKFENNNDSSNLENRILFTQTHCSFQYLNLDSDIVSDCDRIFNDNKLYDEWCKKWKKANRRESKEGKYLGNDQKTTIVEYPIEQQIESELRYYRLQPKLHLLEL